MLIEILLKPLIGRKVRLREGVGVLLGFCAWSIKPIISNV